MGLNNMNRIVNGVEVEMTPEEVEERLKEEAEWQAAQLKYEQTESYKDKRRAAYPPIGDQLDALFHAMEVGVLPQVTDFYDKILAVKETYPAPTAEAK